MANRKSSAAQAIKDMLELGLDITFFIGEITRLHEMNAIIGITSKEKAKKAKKHHTPRFTAKPVVASKKMILRQTVVINPDGTVAIDSNLEWDWK